MAYLNNLADILIYMGYEVGTDFSITDNQDGNGPIIEVWNHVDSEPTEGDVSTFWSNYQADPARLDEKKVAAKLKVDSAAEKARLRFITNGSGQAMVYQEKADEAADFIANSYPAPTGSPPTYVGYPFIQAEINATGKTKEQAADDIIAQRTAWVATGAQIEEERLGGKSAIDSASDETGVNSARDSAITNLDAI